MNIIKTELEGVLIIEPKVFFDSRGYFMETYQKERYDEFGIDTTFIQDNLSYSVKNTLRGLHFQVKHPQAKLVQVLDGEIFDVAVDIRKESKTFGKWTGVKLSSDNKKQLYVPIGFAHGFCVLSETVLFSYKCSDLYHPEDECGILWSDPDIGISWPNLNSIKNDLIISDKDKKYNQLKNLDKSILF